MRQFAGAPARRSRCGASSGLLVTIALILVIGIAVGMKAHQAVRDSQFRHHIFECTQCHHQFRIDPDDQECLQNDEGPYGITKTCPRCGQHAGLCTIVCPACGRNVLRPRDNICPRCRRDIVKTLDEKTARALGKRYRRSDRDARAETAAADAVKLDAISLQAVDIFKDCERLIGPDGYSCQGDADQLAWGLSYVMMGYLGMYEGTGRLDYLDALLRYIEQVLDMRSDRLGLADQVRGRSMPAWLGASHSNGRPYAWLVHAGMITYPMARCAVVLGRDKALAETYRATIDKIVADVDQTIRAFEDDYWPGPGDGEGRYYCRLLQADLPSSQQNAMGRTLVAMYLATGDAWYRERAACLARYFQNRWRVEDGRATWDYWPPQDPQPEDISNAAISIDFAVVCHRANVAFISQDISHLTATFHHLVRPGGFADRVDGSGRSNQHANSAGRWGPLAYFDPAIRLILADYLGAHYQEDIPLGMIAASYLVQTQQEFRVETPLQQAPPPVAGAAWPAIAGPQGGETVGSDAVSP
jgi:hypothetical protein